MNSASIAKAQFRPLISDSIVMKDAYARFMTSVISQGLETISTEETEQYRALVIAGTHRYRLDKETKLVQLEEIHEHAGMPSSWQSCAIALPFVWMSPSVIDRHITNAWYAKLCSSLPAPEVCFPDQEFPRFIWEDRIRNLAKWRTGGRANTKIRRKIFTAALWNFLAEREVLLLTLRYFGRRSTLVHYNFASRHRIQLSTLLNESGAMARILGAYIVHSGMMRRKRCIIGDDLAARAKLWLASPEKAKARTTAPGIVTEKVVGGLSPAGWRMLLRSTWTSNSNVWESFESIGDSGTARANFGTAASLMAAACGPFPFTFTEWIVSELDRWPALTRASDTRANLVRFLRLAGFEAKAAARTGRIRNFVANDLALSWDWLLSADNDVQHEQYALRRIHKNMTWKSIMRNQLRWHETVAERQRQMEAQDAERWAAFERHRSGLSWISLVQQCKVNGIAARPLTSGADLVREHAEMQHCVDDYIPLCVDGKSRIFSLLGPSERSTLELTRQKNTKWTVRQVRGCGNADVSDAMHTASKLLAKLYTDAERLAANLRTPQP